MLAKLFFGSIWLLQNGIGLKGAKAAWCFVATVGFVDGRLFIVAVVAASGAVLVAFRYYPGGKPPRRANTPSGQNRNAETVADSASPVTKAGSVEMTPLRYNILDLARRPRGCGQIRFALHDRGHGERPKVVMAEIALLIEKKLVEAGPAAGQIVLTPAGEMLINSLDG